jgi:hypothetical protein
VSDAITPFRVSLSEAAIDDLRERLRRARWPEPGTVGGWSRGTPLAWVRELCRHWLEDYDFAADGLGIHFVHVRSPHPRRGPAGPDARLAGLGRPGPAGRHAIRVIQSNSPSGPERIRRGS